jgi:transposase InsO family protein
MQLQILKLHDNLEDGAHFGFEKTYNYLIRSFYWPKMIKDIKTYQQTCDICQKIHNDRRPGFGYLQNIPIPRYPFQEVSMDFIMPLPVSNGYNGIYVVTDRFSKYIILRPVTDKINEEETAKLFKTMVVIEHGLPEKVISDRDTRWRGTFWEQLLAQLGAQRALSTAYHPQTDGQTEAVNQILEVALRAYTSEMDWSDKLEDFQMAYNSSVHTATGFTPYFLLNGKEMRKPSNFLIDQSQKERTGIDKQSTALFLDRMEASWNRAKESMQFGQEVQRRSYNASHLPLNMEVGELVLVNPHTLKMSGDWQNLGNKLLPRWEGPFEIIRKYSPNVYQIRLPPDWDIYPVLHVAHLKPYKSSPPEFGNRPDISIRKRKETSYEDWEVVEITAEKYKSSKNRTKLYKAIWRINNVEQETDEWIPAANFKNAPAVLAKWKNTLKLEPKRRAK